MQRNDIIKLADGAGGILMDQLIKQTISSHIWKKRVRDGVGLEELDDGASLRVGGREVVVSIDGHTVDPIFFPGGDIGRLAISGTSNDVAMMGAKPLAIVDSIIVVEGFPMRDLEMIVSSMNETAREIGVAVIGGDFKVMPKGHLDKMVITTAGLGIVRRGRPVLDSGARPGDQVIVTGSIGDHGISLLAAREGLSFRTSLVSDVAPIWKTIEAALSTGKVTAMKDPTRGGLASALNDIASRSRAAIIVHEEKVPIKDGVKAASEMLGLDPFEITCEGRAVICVDQSSAEDTLAAIRGTPYGRNAAVIGEVVDLRPGYVFLETSVGGERILEKPIGEPIPRVC